MGKITILSVLNRCTKFFLELNSEIWSYFIPGYNSRTMLSLFCCWSELLVEFGCLIPVCGKKHNWRGYMVEKKRGEWRKKLKAKEKKDGRNSRMETITEKASSRKCTYATV